MPTSSRHLATSEYKPIIGTLAEHNLHSALKSYIEPDKSKQEIKVGRFVADIKNENGIIEIQTKNLGLLCKKLDYYLENGYNVTVVHPVLVNKSIVWIDSITGDVSNKRKSPKHCNVYSAFAELYHIKDYLQKISVKLLPVDIVEYVYALNGMENRNYRYGSERAEQIPTRIGEYVELASKTDYALLVPDSLDNGFTSADFSKAASVTRADAQITLNILTHLSVVVRTDFNKKGYIYSRA